MASAGSSSIGGHSALNVTIGGGGGSSVLGGGPTDCASLSVSEDVPLELLGVPLGRQNATLSLSLSLTVILKCV